MISYSVRIFVICFIAIQILIEHILAAPTLASPPLNLECVLSQSEIKVLENKKREKILINRFKFSASGIGSAQATLEVDESIEMQAVSKTAAVANANNKSTWEFKSLIQNFQKNKNLNYQINAQLIESQSGIEKPLRTIQLPIMRVQQGEKIKKSWPVDRKEIFDLSCSSQ